MSVCVCVCAKYIYKCLGLSDGICEWDCFSLDADVLLMLLHFCLLLHVAGCTMGKA